jgi:ABC-2 type transport system permease protein
MTASTGTGLAEASPRPLPVDDGSRGRAGAVRAKAAIGGLVWTLIRTDFKARYHGTLSGFVWALLKPTAMFVVLVAVFSFVFRSQPGYKLDLIVGLFLWDFFSDATKTGMTSLSAKGFLLTKARVPKWILVVTSIANALITLMVFAGVVTAYLVLSGHAPSGAALAAFGG